MFVRRHARRATHLVTHSKSLHLFTDTLHDATHITTWNVWEVHFAQRAVCFASQAAIIPGRQRASLDMYQQVFTFRLKDGLWMRGHNAQYIPGLTKGFC